MSDNRDYTLVVSECLVMIQQRGQITMTLGARGPRSYHGTRFPGIPGFSGLSSQSHGALQRNRSMRRSVIRLGGEKGRVTRNSKLRNSTKFSRNLYLSLYSVDNDIVSYKFDSEYILVYLMIILFYFLYLNVQGFII